MSKSKTMSEAKGPSAREEPALSAWPAIPRPVEERRRVLVIEDNQAAADTLGILLALLGHEVRVARTGPEGVKVGRDWKPEVVICDIGLPGLDGYAVASQLRKAAGQAVRLIAVTGYGSDEDRRKAKEAGFDHHLTKPADPATLLQLLTAA